MTTKSLPAHGTYARGNGCPGYRPPCYCDPCVIAKRKARKRSKVNRELGRSAFTDAAPAREHITLLHQSMSWRSISNATTIDDRTLCLIYDGRRTRIARTTHAKIMAVAVPTTVDAWIYVDATGTIRRLRALMTIGHAGRVIAQAAATGQAQIHKVAAGQQPTVRRGFAARIEAVYKQLAFRPAPENRFTARTRGAAAAKGWHGPLAWDDIDDPNAVPEIDKRCKSGRRRGETPELGRIVRLTAEGLTTEQIAARFGVHPRTITRVRSRAIAQLTAA